MKTVSKLDTRLLKFIRKEMLDISTLRVEIFCCFRLSIYSFFLKMWFCMPDVERCEGTQVIWKGDGKCYTLGERYVPYLKLRYTALDPAALTPVPFPPSHRKILKISLCWINSDGSSDWNFCHFDLKNQVIFLNLHMLLVRIRYGVVGADAGAGSRNVAGSIKMMRLML
jgi:hypothetical protein